jgi:hypothetical protein
LQAGVVPILPRPESEEAGSIISLRAEKMI